MSLRPIKHVLKSKPAIEGAGVHLRRAFGFGEDAEGTAGRHEPGPRPKSDGVRVFSDSRLVHIFPAQPRVEQWFEGHFVGPRRRSNRCGREADGESFHHVISVTGESEFRFEG